ncbi:MAG: peptide chain release factor N(5)-glutamine methyltransferase [Phycisphaerales bacterium]|jgi:release factor glutamine methyltransferase|nr:peptide chain release factor N(5)-glutamine methyltransferase [Phycisphaerales bacterium]
MIPHDQILAVGSGSQRRAWYPSLVSASTHQRSKQVWSTRDLLAWIESHLGSRSVDEPALVARWLVAKAIGTDPIHLYTDLDRPASDEERSVLRELVQRASRHEPVQYLVGEAGFLGRLFDVGPGVLIPRTATETLVQHVLTWHRGLDPAERPDPLWIADLGTGSGCIAVTLAMHLESAKVIAVDRSEAALAWANRNVDRHEMSDRVTCVAGDLYDGLRDRACGGRVHAIVSNPPYISEGRWDEMAANVRSFEPAEALRAGVDGLDVVRRIITSAPAHLLPGGLLVIEIDDHHASEACQCANDQSGLINCRVIQDEFGDDRFVTAVRD